VSGEPTLCAELDPLLAAELAAGNSVAYRERATTRAEARLVMLATPFRTPAPQGGAVERIDVNDPHWWDVEYRCTLHGHQLVSPPASLGYSSRA
jgi:hypothetical protein